MKMRLLLAVVFSFGLLAGPFVLASPPSLCDTKPWLPQCDGGAEAGPPGPQGPQGETGPQGPQGETGETGPAGPQGEAGADGETGPAGPQGEAGADGETGPQGETGVAGEAGVDGQPGIQGNDGQSGPQGPVGQTGAQGEQGIQGPTGIDGRDGIDGAQGPQGDVGPQGVQGPPGEVVFVSPPQLVPPTLSVAVDFQSVPLGFVRIELPGLWVLADHEDSYVQLRSVVYNDGTELVPPGEFIRLEGLVFGEIYYLGSDGQPSLDPSVLELGVMVDVDVMLFYPVVVR